MKLSIIKAYLSCPVCKSSTLDVVPFDAADDELTNAVVTCCSCATWYRLEDGLLELLVPSLRNFTRTESFRKRFAMRWDGWDRHTLEMVHSPDDAHKIEQKDFYDDDAIEYENDMLQLSFWNAFDRTYIEEIRAFAGGRDVMLEIGGGTGRISLPMREDFKLILSFDLSEAMVRTAIRKREQLGLSAAHVHDFVADAENIPVQPSCAQVAVFSGILHHVENPGVVIREATRTLMAGGRFLGSENNRSAFRSIFDLLMRVKKLWNEKAHEEHFIISYRELNNWFFEAGISGNVWTSVFLPPHLFNLLPVPNAESLLRRSDAFGRCIPWFRMQGGLVLFSGEKMNC